jgi:hypothetical protein
VQGWTLAVTPRRLAAWCAAFARMRQAGVDIEITVDHSPRVAAVQGYLVDMFVEGDRLYGVHEMLGQSAIDLARRVKNVSVEIDPSFVDGRGTRYGEAIVRSSLVQQPVVPGQDHFVPLAASRGGDVSSDTMRPAPVLLWSGEAVDAVDVADDPAEDQFGATAADRPDELAQRLARSEQRVLSLQRELASARPPAVEAGLLDELADAAETRLEALVEQGRVSPATRDRLAVLLLGSPQRRPAVMLARGAARHAGFDQPLARMILDALALNDVPPLGERTASQALVLARQVPGLNSDEPDEQTRQRMTQAAYGA